ncbi:MAG: flavin monoamine oxidase family protein [Solirubrobacterales bacterium]
MSQSPMSDQLDVAVVGGGVSGLYSAWRLLETAKEEGKRLRVTVFERSERLGGRLLTWLPRGTEGGLRAELGGMRFLKQQELVCELLTELGFGVDDVVPFFVKGENLRLLLRGVSRRLDNPKRTKRYRLPPDQQGKEAGDLIEEMIKKVVLDPENASCLECGFPKTREQWDKAKPCLTWKGRRLWDIGFWNLLAEVCSAETYQYMTDAFGYYSLASNWNAAEAMQFLSLDFTTKPAPGEPEYLTLRQGYEALPQALAEKVESLGGKIVTETRLVSFEAPRGENVRATFTCPHTTFEVQAESLVLGLPRRSLELLAPSRDFDLQGDEGLRRQIESVVPVPAFKFFLFFKERWWETKFGIKCGRSICDLPIRQTYYMGPDSLYEENPKSTVPPWGLVMASYGDARSVDFWQGMVPPRRKWKQGRAELLEEMAELAAQVGLEDGASIPDPPPELNKATPQMIEHARKQLALLHGVELEEIPEPSVGAFADWGFDPYGGGWNFWQPQVDVRKTMGEVKAPLGDDRPVYIVGESYSGAPGWVEGALTTTELVLQRYFSLKEPSWLPSNYYLGW